MCDIRSRNLGSSLLRWLCSYLAKAYVMDWIDRATRRVRLRDLHMLMAVAEAGSMSKASARLAVSHPVVSKTISDLERTLACASLTERAMA